MGILSVKANGQSEPLLGNLVLDIDAEKAPASPSFRMRRARTRLSVIFATVIAALVFVHAIRLNPNIASKIWKPIVTTHDEFHIMIPANETSLELCQNILSGMLLNYPVPTLINWGRNYTDDDSPGGYSHLTRISGVRSFINSKHKGEWPYLYLMVDGRDSWYQLPPEILLKRFKRAIESSNDYTKWRMGRAWSEERLNQAIIFSTTKECPNEHNDIGCFATPESSLPADLYGENTDTEQGHDKGSSVRQRFISPNVIVGPLGDFKQIMDRAWEKHDAEQKIYGQTEQNLYSTIYGEQEFQRSYMVRRHRNWIERLRRSILQLRGQVLPDPVEVLDQHPVVMDEDVIRQHDFGIGLDYDASISHQVTGAEWDGRFITHSNLDPDLNLSEFDCTPHLQPLDSDLLASSITSPRVKHEQVLQNTTWNDLPLYTQICTGQVPVIISHRRDDKESRQKLWEQFWMAPMATELFKDQRDLVKAQSPEGESSAHMGINIGAANTDTGEMLLWDDLCGRYSVELFGEQLTFGPKAGKAKGEAGKGEADAAATADPKAPVDVEDAAEADDAGKLAEAPPAAAKAAHAQAKAEPAEAELAEPEDAVGIAPNGAAARVEDVEGEGEGELEPGAR